MCVDAAHRHESNNLMSFMSCSQTHRYHMLIRMVTMHPREETRPISYPLVSNHSRLLPIFVQSFAMPP